MVPCAHRRGCAHCLAVEEVRRIEHAALVTAAGGEATDAERQGVVDLLLHIAQQRVPSRGVRPKDYKGPMSTKKKPNPASYETLRALEEAKTIRTQRYAHKDKRILSMIADGVPKSEIKKTLRTGDHYIAKVLARSAS